MDVEPASWPMERCSSTSCSGRTQRIVKPDTMQCDLLNKCIGSDPCPSFSDVHDAEGFLVFFPRSWRRHLGRMSFVRPCNE